MYINFKNVKFLSVFLCCFWFSARSQNDLTHYKEQYPKVMLSSNDSLKQDFLKNCIKASYKEKNWELFNICRKSHISLVQRIKDSLSLAKTYEYTGRYFEIEHKSDSAYYYYLKGTELYKAKKDSSGLVRFLLNTAILQKNVRDYTGSEITSFEALEYIPKGKNKKREASVYNNLGLVYDALEDFENALKYHKKALNLKRQIESNPKYLISSINNIGKLYKKNEKYSEAIYHFKKGLAYDRFLIENPKTKAILIDNYGHALFKNGDPEEGFKLMSEALKVREDQNHLDGIAISSLHLADYYITKEDTLSAIDLADRAETLTKKTKNYRDYLEALNLKSNLYESKKSKEYFSKYNYVKDSLDLVARNYINNFGRIKYELAEHENKLRDQERSLTIKQYIIIGLLTLIGIFLLIYCRKLIIKRKLEKEFKKGLRNYLINKYNLTLQNIEFWELWITGIDQTQMSEKLFISVDAVKSRRKSLRDRIDKTIKIEGNFTQTKAIHSYNKENEIYSNYSSNHD